MPEQFNPKTLEEAFTELNQRGLYWGLRRYDETKVSADVGTEWDNETEIADTPLNALVEAAKKWFARQEK